MTGSVGSAPAWRGSWGSHGIAIDAEPGLEPLLEAFAPRPSETLRTELAVHLSCRQPGPLVTAPPAWRVAARWAAGEQLRVRGAEGSRRLFDPFSRTVTHYQPARATAEIWIESPERVPAWARAAPGLQLIDWWSAGRDMLAAHGAAVAFGGQTALLLGPGGSGKSTFAVEAAGRGYAFLGDDYVLLEPGPPPRVHALYRSAKLLVGEEETRAGFGLAFARAAGDGKAVHFADDAALTATAPLAAVILPRIGAGKRPVLTPISPAEAVRRAAPSILRQMPGVEARKLALLARGVASRPCFALELANDHGANVGAVAELVARLAEGAARG